MNLHISEYKLQAIAENPDNQLSDKEMRHLLTCIKCEKTIHVYRNLYKSLNQEDKIELTDNFLQNVMTHLYELNKKSNNNIIQLIAKSMLAAMTIISIILLITIRNNDLVQYFLGIIHLLKSGFYQLPFHSLFNTEFTQHALMGMSGLIGLYLIDYLKNMVLLKK